MQLVSYDKLTSFEFGGLSTFQFLAFLRRSIFYTFIAIYLRVVLNLSTTEVTLMATFGMIANTSAQTLLWGNLLDKIKRSNLFVIFGEGMAGIGHFLLYIWHRHALTISNRYAGYTIIVGLASIEVFWSMSNVGFSALIAEHTYDNERKKLMGQLTMIGGLGGIVGATLGGMFYKGGLGFSSGFLFYFVGIIMIISSFIVLLTIKSTGNITINKGKNKKYPLSDMNRQLLIIYIIFLISLALINFGRNSIALIQNFYLVDKGAYSATDEQVALFRNIANLSTLIFGFLLGSIMSKLKDNRVLFMGIGFAVIGIFWLGYAPTFNLALISAGLIGGSHVIISTSSYAIAAKIIPEEYRGRLFSYYNATFFLSWGLGATILTGPLSDYLIKIGYSTADAYRASFIAAVTLTLLGAFMMLFIISQAVNGHKSSVDNIIENNN